MKIPLMPQDELRKFVDGVASHQILILQDIVVIDPTLAGNVFLPLQLGILKDLNEENIKQIGTIWEWKSKASTISINGYPMFFSCRIMHMDDWKRAKPAILLEIKRREEIEV